MIKPKNIIMGLFYKTVPIFQTILLLSVLFLAACGNVILDNNSEGSRYVYIDDKELPYQIAPKSNETISLKKGTHVLKIEDSNQKIIAEAKINVKEGGLVNLGQTNYWIWTDLYGNPQLKKTALKEEWIDIGGQTYFGEFEKLANTQYYFEKSWDYGVDNNFPKQQFKLLFFGKGKYEIKKKIFRENELVDAYKKLAK